MKAKILIVLMLLTVSLGAVPAQLVQTVAACKVASNSEPSSPQAEVNFDELEDIALGCNAFEKAEFSKPSRILILLRILGMPLFNAYLKMTDGMAQFSTWLNSIFKKKSKCT